MLFSVCSFGHPLLIFPQQFDVISPPLIQGFLTSPLLTFWTRYIFGVGKCLVYYSILGFYPLDASRTFPSTPSTKLWQLKISPETAKMFPGEQNNPWLRVTALPLQSTHGIKRFKTRHTWIWNLALSLLILWLWGSYLTSLRFSFLAKCENNSFMVGSIVRIIWVLGVIQTCLGLSGNLLEEPSSCWFAVAQEHLRENSFSRIDRQGHFVTTTMTRK